MAAERIERTTPESAARWFRLFVLVAWALGLLGLLCSVAIAVGVSEGNPGIVVLGLTSAACGWLLVVVRQFPEWRSRRRR